MDDKARTPRENYERMMRGEEVETGKKANVAFAKHLLRSQAGKLATEPCIKGMAFSNDDVNPWAVTLSFSPGELSHNAQVILDAMRSNAHRTEVSESDRWARVEFYVYTLEED